jgi:hypothetical protein
VSLDVAATGEAQAVQAAGRTSGRSAGRAVKAPGAIDHVHEGGGVPTISMFYGLLIRMFFRDTEKHHVPHIHADYQGQVAVYSILDGMVLAGELPPNKHKLVVAWIEIHHEDLLADWDLAVNGKKPFPIKGLDQ